jgi:hypothetical protein
MVSATQSFATADGIYSTSSSTLFLDAIWSLHVSLYSFFFLPLYTFSYLKRCNYLGSCHVLSLPILLAFSSSPLSHVFAGSPPSPDRSISCPTPFPKRATSRSSCAAGPKGINSIKGAAGELRRWLHGGCCLLRSCSGGADAIQDNIMALKLALDKALTPLSL